MYELPLTVFLILASIWLLKQLIRDESVKAKKPTLRECESDEEYMIYVNKSLEVYHKAPCQDITTKSKILRRCEHCKHKHKTSK